MSRSQTRIGSFVVLLAAAVMALLFATRPASTQGTLSLQGDITSVTVTSPACSAGSFVATLTGGATKGAAPVGGTCVAEVGDISTVTTTANMGLTGGGTSGAVSVGLLSTCANGQVLVAGGTGTTWTCGTAGGESTVAGAGLTLTGSTVDVIGSTGITVLADSVTLSLAGASCASGSFMTALGATGTGTCSTATSIVSGTTNTMAKFTSATAVGNSSVTDTGSLVTVANPTRIDIGTSGAVAALAGSTLIVEGAAATNNYFSMLTDNGVNGGILFNTPTGSADGYVIYDGTNRRLGLAAGGLQNLKLTGTLFTVEVASTMSGLVTATLGVTTPANLTTTGTGDLVSGDQLTVASHATISGNLIANGDTTIGDAITDIHTFTGVHKIGTTGLWARSDEASLNVAYADATTATLYLNYRAAGGGGGSRNAIIADGAAATIVNFNGAAKSAAFAGAVTVATTLGVTGVTTLTGALDSAGTAPTPTSCGTSPTSTGGVWAFKMTLGTGTAASCTAALPFSTSPICALGSEITTRGDIVISALSATSITVTSVSGVNMASGKINVICVGDG